MCDHMYTHRSPFRDAADIDTFIEALNKLKVAEKTHRGQQTEHTHTLLYMQCIHTYIQTSTHTYIYCKQTYIKYKHTSSKYIEYIDTNRTGKGGVGGGGCVHHTSTQIVYDTSLIPTLVTRCGAGGQWDQSSHP